MTNENDLDLSPTPLNSVLKGTLNSYKVLKRCPKFWNDDFMEKLDKLSVNKSLYVVRSMSELNNFVSKHVNS